MVVDFCAPVISLLKQKNLKNICFTFSEQIYIAAMNEASNECCCNFLFPNSMISYAVFKGDKLAIFKSF